MTNFAENGMSPAAAELGAAIYTQIVNGADVDTAFDAAVEYGPSFVLGRAAMTLTDGTDMRTAVEELFTDTEIQSRVFADLTAIDEHGLARLPEIQRERRLEQLRSVATCGAVDIRNLQRGESVTAVYEPRRRSLGAAVLEVARTHAGTDNDDKGVIIRSAHGERLRHGRTLRVGDSVFLGYRHNGTAHSSTLMRGAPPAWATRLIKHSNENGEVSWSYEKLFRDPRFALAQVYLGNAAEHPLFV